MKKGFTLLEVLASVLLMGLGIVVLFRPLLASLDQLRDLEFRYEAEALAAQKAWESREQVRLGEIKPGTSSGTWVGAKTVYQYHATFSPEDSNGILWKIDTEISWRRSGKTKNLNRLFYWAALEAERAP
ncbi:MAG: type IV pilus modification PilV family protein [Candidatus Omnitrophota bacterium]